MGKYIDADKLITEIEQLKETNKVSTVPTMKASEYVQGGIYGFDLAIEKIVAIIASHMQEQLEINETEVVESEATINGIKTKLNIIVFVVPDDWKPGDKVESIITRKEE